jgi:hypothetical protein
VVVSPAITSRSYLFSDTSTGAGRGIGSADAVEKNIFRRNNVEDLTG